jgi:hypothetical protein
MGQSNATQGENTRNPSALLLVNPTRVNQPKKKKKKKKKKISKQLLIRIFPLRIFHFSLPLSLPQTSFSLPPLPPTTVHHQIAPATTNQRLPPTSSASAHHEAVPPPTIRLFPSLSLSPKTFPSPLSHPPPSSASAHREAAPPPTERRHSFRLCPPNDGRYVSLFILWLFWVLSPQRSGHLGPKPKSFE